MNVRRAELEDAKGIAIVQVDTWRTAYKGIVPDDYLQSLSYEKREQVWQSAIPHGHVFVAENNKGEIVGFSSSGKERSGKYEGYNGELYAIYILEEYQGQGIGKELVKIAAKYLQKLHLNSMTVVVLEDNSACLFYEKLGGKLIGNDVIELSGKKLKERVYGWEDITPLL